MEDTEGELRRLGEMGHTGHNRVPERPIIGPGGAGSIDGGVVEGRVAWSIGGDGQALPLHPRVEYPQKEVKETMGAQFALWSPLGHGKRRQEKCGEVVCGQWHGHWCRCELWCRQAQQGSASFAVW
jgi:hypothetical protein